MSKIICDVCGTSYPDSATQCPICGCVRPADAQNIVAENIEKDTAVPYQHVKGGRFSKANVRKRATSNAAASRENAQTRPNTQSSSKKRQKGNVGLVVTVFILLIAILVVIGYIAVQLLRNPGSEQAAGDQYAVAPPTDPVPSEQTIRCRNITLETDAYTINAVGQKVTLKAQCLPADTTDTLTYASSDETVAIVDSNGVVTAMDYGETVITVSCGRAQIQCQVLVEMPFALDMNSVRFEAVLQEQLLYSGAIPLDQIAWSSDNISVANIVNGTVWAVAPGTTTVYGEYKGQVQKCSVECAFAEPTETPTEAPATAPEPEGTTAASANGPFRLKNLYGPNNSDVSLNVGESFALALVDANGNRVSGVTWSVENGSSCTVDDGTVQAIASGYAEVVAFYNGEKYTCIVRVR